MKAKKLFPDTSMNRIFDKLKDGVGGGSITVKVTADEQLVGKTLTITNGVDSFSEVVSASMELEFNLNALGTWNITNPITDKVQKLDIKYYGIHDIEVHCYRIYSIIIDHAIADPLDCCTYADDAAGMTKGSMDWFNQPIFKDLKNCVLINGSVGAYLNKDNLNFDVDGNAVVPTYFNDIMLEVPRTGYKFEWLDGARLKVSVTDNPNDPKFNYDAFSLDNYNDCDKVYIGVYHNFYPSASDPRLTSISGKAPDLLSIDNARAYARNRGAGFNIYSFNIHKLIQCLYVIFAGNLDSQTVIGVGGSVATTGATSEYGFMSEKIKETHPEYMLSTSYLIKCFGIEAPWGYAIWLDGYRINSSREILTCQCAKDLGNTANYNNNGKGMNKDGSGYMSRPIGTNNLGFAGLEISGSATTLYCDQYWEKAGGWATCGSKEGGNSGIFRMDSDFQSSSATAASRLTYHHKEV